MLIEVGVLCRVFVFYCYYVYVNCSGSITEVGEESFLEFWLTVLVFTVMGPLYCFIIVFMLMSVSEMLHLWS